MPCKLLKYQSVICLSADSVSDVIVIGFITHTPHVHQQFSWPHLHRAAFCCFSFHLPFPPIFIPLSCQRKTLHRATFNLAFRLLLLLLRLPLNVIKMCLR